MKRMLYQAPIILQSSGGNASVIGDGSGQGTIAPEGMTYEEWWDEIAWGGDNPDADYNGDGTVNEDDYKYYIENELWKGED